MADRDHNKFVQALRMVQLKRRLRRWKRPLWSIAITIIVLGALGYGVAIMEDAKQSVKAANDSLEHAQETFMLLHENDNEPSPATQQVMKRLTHGGDKYAVIHRIQYVCGKQDHSLGKKSSAAIITLVLDHPDWEASMDVEGKVILEEQVNEMSEPCKRSAHIGIDSEGNLTLYDGKPEDERVMRTFFQLDIEYMESSLPPRVLKQLQGGIRVLDIVDYDGVIATFSDYAVEDTRKVMKPTTMP